MVTPRWPAVPVNHPTRDGHLLAGLTPDMVGTQFRPTGAGHPPPRYLGHPHLAALAHAMRTHHHPLDSIERMFDAGCMPDYANAARPPRIPVRPGTDPYPVQARLVGLDGTETWTPATVVRATPSGHLMIPDLRRRQQLNSDHSVGLRG